MSAVGTASTWQDKVTFSSPIATSLMPEAGLDSAIIGAFRTKRK